MMTASYIATWASEALHGWHTPRSSLRHNE